MDNKTIEQAEADTNAPVFNPDVDPARDDPNPEYDILRELSDDQITVYRMGGTWAQVFFATNTSSW